MQPVGVIKPLQGEEAVIYKIPDQVVDELHKSVEKMERIAHRDRGSWQKAIEQSVVDFNADAAEAMELLDALIAGLKNRYGKHEVSDIEHRADQMRTVLEDLDRTYRGRGVSKDDLEAWRDWQARHEEE